MKKVFCRLTLFRFGMKRFERDVNAYLQLGWEIELFEVKKVGLFRFLCLAIIKSKKSDYDAGFYNK
jgi:hypothetical protein